jgi:hypothetical protein
LEELKGIKKLVIKKSVILKICRYEVHDFVDMLEEEQGGIKFDIKVALC